MRLMENVKVINLFFLVLFGLLISGCSHNRKFQKKRDGILIPIGKTLLKLQVCDSNIIRVVHSPTNALSKRGSLAVDAKWKPVEWSLKEDSASVTVETGSVSARVLLADGRIAFLDGNGNTLLKSAGMDSCTFQPAIVQEEAVFHVRQAFEISADEGLYGLGQFQDGIMNWRGKDVLLVQANRIAVNPFLVSTHGYGILWDNASETKFHDGPGGMTFWSEVADQIDYYFVHGASMDDVIAGYRRATGRAPMFPKWAYGYWQSKERYRSGAELLDVAKEFRDRRIPIDAIVQDWQYWGDEDRWSGMIWTPDRFPDPKATIDSLHDRCHIRLMNSIWPAVGVQTDLYRELKKNGLVFDKHHWSNGKLYDAYSSEARDIYWRHLNKGLFSVGVDAFWMDATEPELTSTGDSYVTESEIKACGRNALGTFSRYLNPYSLMTTKGVYENWRRTTRDKRPFILTRSAFAGQQRYAAAVWSGDIGSSWDVFRRQISAGINFCMSGIPYWTTDIGGFLPDLQGGMYPEGGSDPAFQELYVRWYQFGAFCPIFRSHGTGTPREPWRFGGPGSANYDAIVRFDNLRYRLMPYLYSTASRITRDGYTMMRGLAMDFASDPKILGIGDEYMFGPSFLVCPVTREMFHKTKKQEDFIPASNLFMPDGGMGRWRVEFFRGGNFEEKIQDSFMVETALTWAGSIPEPLLMTEYAVRWTGQVLTRDKGTYRFTVRTDGGARVWVDGKKLIDRWNNDLPSVERADVLLTGGTRVPVRIEHRQKRPGAASFRFEWIPPERPDHLPKNGIECYLPAGCEWTDFWSGDRIPGGRSMVRETPIDVLPLYVRAGSIVPMGPFLQYAEEKPADPIELRVYPGADASFTLYEDEGDNLNYEMGSYAVIPIRWDDASETLTVGKRKGGFPGMLKERTFNVVRVGRNHGIGAEITATPDHTVRYSGVETTVRMAK
jgi:alpha-D-xyloside xylohydrolase